MPDERTLTPPPAAILFDPELPLPMRREALQMAIKGDGPRARETLDKLLERADAGREAARCAEKARELEEKLAELQRGPVRSAVFIGPGHQASRAHLLFGDGTEAQVYVPDEDLTLELRRGDTVWVEPQGHAVLARVPCGTEVGEIARIESRVDDLRVVVTQSEASRGAWRLSADLAEAYDRGEVGPGSEVIGDPLRKIAYSAVNGSGPHGLRFLERRPPPAIDPERDLGCPPSFIAEVAQHVEIVMTEPELARSFGLGSARSLLLTGAPGTGKSFSISALLRVLYEVMSRVTGAPVEGLPFRVVRLRPSQVLSMWVGNSEKNLDELFDQVRVMADETFTGPDGREHVLPVIVIGEEIEALARARGGHEAVHDRIQTTLLERFETSSEEWRERLVIFLFTTNVPQLVDSAMFRRAGGEVVRLRALDRRSFAAVLEKQLRKRRLRAGLGEAGEARARLVAELTSWVFAPASDPGQVEIHLLGTPAPLVKHRRDFMTAALVQRAVERASQVACLAGRAGDPDPGLDRAALARALHDQVRALVEHLHPSNVGTHVELTRDVQVRAVHPIRQPALLAPELEVPASSASAR
jgi:ATP-dependent 26S proteasome regulatory subunit